MADGAIGTTQIADGSITAAKNSGGTASTPVLIAIHDNPQMRHMAMYRPAVVADMGTRGRAARIGTPEDTSR